MATGVSVRLSAALILIAPVYAWSQSMSVIGGESTAHECYLAATLAAQMNIASRQDLETCTYALEHATLNLHDKAATFLNRGIINVAIERYEDAKQDYDRAKKLLPDHGEIYVNRGNIFFMGEVYEQAVAEYDHAIELNLSKLHIAYFNRGLAYEKLGEYHKAGEDYRKAMDLSPQWQLPRARLERLQDRINKDT
jgi:tetratricopeptide (TPR) repeat protein